MEANWNADFTIAILSGEDGDLLGWLRLDHWYDVGARVPRLAWVAQYFNGAVAEPEVAVVLVDELGEPARDATRQEELAAAAHDAIAAGPPPLPPPQPAGGPAIQGVAEIELLVDAWDASQSRLFRAANIDDESSRDRIYIALTELLNWTFTLDLVLSLLWKHLDFATREAASQQVDAQVAAAIENNRTAFAKHGRTWVEPQSGIFAAARQRQGDHAPYPAWPLLLGMRRKDVDPRFFNGLKWVRGQAVHRGVIHAVDLRQWRPGAEPRWKWQPVCAIPHETTGKSLLQLHDYEAVVAGRDVLGSLDLWDEWHDILEIFRNLL